MRRQVGYYASTPAYRPVLELHGWGDLQTALYDCSKKGAWLDMARLVDDEVLDTLTIICRPSELAAEVGARYGGLVDRINVSWWRKEWWPDVERGAASAVTTTVGGFAAPGFERVAETLGEGATLVVGDRERRADLGDGGGAFAAFVDGECVVDVWTGSAGADGTGHGRKGRSAVIMSSTKGLTTLCAHVLEDRGELDLDADVVRYWPEFGCLGKESTTVRQLLSHQSGAIGLPGSDELLAWDGTGWSDTVAIAAGVAAGAPAWEPGTRHGYHGVTFGWLVGELVRRISGLSLGRFFADEVVGQLGDAAANECCHRDADRRAGVGGHGHGVPRETRQAGNAARDRPRVEGGPLRAGGRTREPVRRRARQAALRGLHEHADRAPGRDRRARVPPLRRGRSLVCTRRWRPVKSSCRAHRWSASGSSRCAAATR